MATKGTQAAQAPEGERRGNETNLATVLTRLAHRLPSTEAMDYLGIALWIVIANVEDPRQLLNAWAADFLDATLDGFSPAHRKRLDSWCAQALAAANELEGAAQQLVTESGD